MTERAPDSPENPHAGRGKSVVLDIGGDIGALIVTMPLAMVGDEVEIVPEGTALEHVHDTDEGADAVGHGHGHGHGHRLHVAVVRRPTPSGEEVPSLVFGELEQGRYDLLHKGTDDVILTEEVRGGEVTMATWPGVSSDG